MVAVAVLMQALSVKFATVRVLPPEALKCILTPVPIEEIQSQQHVLFGTTAYLGALMHLFSARDLDLGEA